MKTWDDVMAKLTGARLAVLDALLRGGEQSALRIAAACERQSAPEVLEALQWLRACHLVTMPAAGLFRARSVAAARERFDRAGGPIAEFMQGLREMDSPAASGTAVHPLAAPAPFFTPANAVPSGVRVQDHQVQMFADV
jgi:hypothetical protein